MFKQNTYIYKKPHAPKFEEKSEGSFVSPAANLASEARPKKVPKH